MAGSIKRIEDAFAHRAHMGPGRDHDGLVAIAAHKDRRAAFVRLCRARSVRRNEQEEDKGNAAQTDGSLQSDHHHQSM